jgi:hypothetical protein
METYVHGRTGQVQWLVFLEVEIGQESANATRKVSLTITDRGGWIQRIHVDQAKREIENGSRSMRYRVKSSPGKSLGDEHSGQSGGQKPKKHTQGKRKVSYRICITCRKKRKTQCNASAPERRKQQNNKMRSENIHHLCDSFTPPAPNGPLSAPLSTKYLLLHL